MKASELRIGNYFKWSSYASMGIGIDKITSASHYQHNKLRKPIPLTEEWLLKFGFNKVGVNFELQWFVIWSYNKEYNFTFRHDDNIHHIKHVHQLQNLYFAICGIELKINDK